MKSSFHMLPAVTEVFEGQANLGRDTTGFVWECEQFNTQYTSVDPARCRMLVFTCLQSA